MAWEREREAFRRQESAGVLFFRVAVMLSCLILVPLAAIFGSAFPDLVKTELVERIKVLAGMDSRPTQASPTVASSEITALPPVSVEAPQWNASEPAPAWQPAVSPATAHQVDYTATTPIAELPVKQAVATQAVDHFTEIQQRLRVYGASRYALEAVGGGGDLYRFHCTMTASGSPQGEEFQAVDRDPLQAMAKVLDQVEAWRSKRPQVLSTSAGFGR